MNDIDTSNREEKFILGNHDQNPILKASLSLSGELALSTLLENLIMIMIENTEAQLGYLIIPFENSKKWKIETSGGTVGDDRIIVRGTNIEDSKILPLSVINDVIKTKLYVIVGDTGSNLKFQNDPYFVQKKCKSLFCAPIVHNGKINAILYLENSIKKNAFTKERLKAIHLLFSQAAISIENANLYQEMESRIKARTTELEDTLLEAQLKELELEDKTGQLEDALLQTRLKEIELGYRAQLISEKNRIFQALLKTAASIDKQEGMVGVFHYTLDRLSKLFPKWKFGIIINGERPELIQCAVFNGLNQAEQELIVEQQKDIQIKLDQNERTRSLRKPQPLSILGSQKELFILPVLRQQKEIIGKMIIGGNSEDTESIETITLFLDQATSVAINKMLRDQLEKLANTDGLTGLSNRAFFDRELEKVIHMADSFPKFYFSVLIIDINGLKPINDQYGHEKGDEMIVKAAQILKAACRKTDISSRIGGDEFAVLCPGNDSEAVSKLLSRIRDIEKNCKLEVLEDDSMKEIPIRISIGVAGSENCSPEAVLRTADKRMYADKESFYKNRKRYR